jgi:hypothetical protein
MADSATRSRFSPSSIRSQIQNPIDTIPTPEAPAAVLEASSSDKVDPLPRPGDGYQVAGRHGNKPDLTIHFVLKDYSYEGFSYADCERVRLVTSEKPGSGPVLVLRFNGSVITEVVIEGRHLHALYHWIGLHRLPWVWEHPSPAHFSDQNAAIISRITISEIER